MSRWDYIMVNKLWASEYVPCEHTCNTCTIIVHVIIMKVVTERNMVDYSDNKELLILHVLATRFAYLYVLI